MSAHFDFFVIECVSSCVLATDSSKAGPTSRSPKDAMLSVYASHFNNTVVVVPTLPMEMQGFLYSPVVTRMAARLEEADIMGSAGLGWQSYDKRTRILHEENPAIAPAAPDVKTYKGFVGFVVGNTFHTPGARELFEPVMRSMLDDAQDATHQQQQAQRPLAFGSS